ncbi:MAG: SGNH/GDSL hydrolase family protein [Akkermansiaceae bacterium]
MKLMPIVPLVTLFFCACHSFAEEVSENSPLPRILLIGDSISGGYQQGVKKQLEGKAEVVKNRGNAEWTGTGLLKIDEYLGDRSWDLIHFNWGLWDLYGWRYHKEDRSPEAYAKRLDQLVTRMKKTGAKLIWATTTPACPEPEVTMKRRWKQDVVISVEGQAKYRKAALAVMKKHGVAVNDLYGLMKSDLAKYATGPDNVHYNSAGCKRLANQVAVVLEKAMQELSSK